MWQPTATTRSGIHQHGFYWQWQSTPPTAAAAKADADGPQEQASQGSQRAAATAEPKRCGRTTLGIPLGIACARRPRLFALVRPVLDFMQSMPSFVYLIPVVAFFGAGKPAAIVATLIFGSPPVVRLTVLGLQQVPASVREAALAFGASPSYLLWKVDLPLAARTIMAGVNQTILLSLAMVVVASLIGAKGLGEEVLEALQYASEGQGLLAGLAILCCALILDRIVQGKDKPNAM